MAIGGSLIGLWGILDKKGAIYLILVITITFITFIVTYKTNDMKLHSMRHIENISIN